MDITSEEISISRDSAEEESSNLKTWRFWLFNRRVYLDIGKDGWEISPVGSPVKF
jgi:hypothetical protein